VLTHPAEYNGDRDGGRDQTTHRNSLRPNLRNLSGDAIP